MGVFALAIIMFLRIIGALAAVFLVVVLAALLLPLFIEISGFLTAENNLEEVLDRLGSHEDETLEVVLFPLDYGFNIHVRAFLGAFCLQLSSDGPSGIKVMGVSLRKPQTKKGKPTKQPRILKEKRTKKEVSKTSRTRKKKSGSKVFRQLFSRPLRTKAVSAIKELFRAANIESDVLLEFGFRDPGYTGMIYGFLVALIGGLGLEGVAVHPVFQRQIIFVQGEVSSSMVPGHGLWLVGCFILDPAVRKLWRKKGRKRKDLSASNE